MVMRYVACCDHNDDIDQLPISARPSHQSFELNREGRMEGDDRGGHPQISLSHSKL